MCLLEDSGVWGVAGACPGEAGCGTADAELIRIGWGGRLSRKVN